MGRILIPFLAVMYISYVQSAPQFITFKEGKLGVNFGGYHAGVGLGGLLGGGAGGGLFAEAGTPHGQSARAGLGGAVDGEGRAGGALYAGATAGGNVKAEAGLGGKVAAENTGGVGYASAQAGGHHAESGLAGGTSVHGSSGIAFSGTKSISIPAPVVTEEKVSVIPVETIKYKTVHNVDALNEVAPVAGGLEAHAGAHVNVEAQAPKTVIVKEVYVEPQPQIIEKHIIHTHKKPHRHNFHKTAFIGGYIGGGADLAPAPVVYKTVQPVIEKRIDVGVEGAANVGASADVAGHGGGQVAYTKEITVARNPTFFQDIFNIPISTLKAVSGFLSNTAANTNISVQKSATVQAGAYV